MDMQGWVSQEVVIERDFVSLSSIKMKQNSAWDGQSGHSIRCTCFWTFTNRVTYLNSILYISDLLSIYI